jgi:hypothetical protein
MGLTAKIKQPSFAFRRAQSFGGQDMILPGKKSPSPLARLWRWILSMGKIGQNIRRSTSTEALLPTTMYNWIKKEAPCRSVGTELWRTRQFQTG